MSGDLTDIDTRVLLLHILYLQPPVVGVGEAGPDPGVPRVGGVTHGEQVRYRPRHHCVAQPSDL